VYIKISYIGLYTTTAGLSIDVRTFKNIFKQLKYVENVTQIKKRL